MFMSGFLQASEVQSSVEQSETVKKINQISYSQQMSFPAQGVGILQFSPESSSEQRSFSVFGESRNVKEELQQIGLLYDYGVTSNLSLGFSTLFGLKNVAKSNNFGTSNFKYSGIGDLHIQTTYISKLSKINLFYSADLGLGDKGKVATRSDEGNLHSGGLSITPSIAMETDASFGSMGTRLSYTLKGLRKFDYGDFEIVDQGANELNIMGFVEYQKSKTTYFGIRANLNFIEAETESVNDGFGDYKNDPKTILTTAVYGTFYANENFYLKPTISYKELQTKTINGINYSRNDITGLNLSIGAIF